MKKQQDQVRDFHKAFGHPVGNTGPKPMEPERRLSRSAWMAEEVVEFMTADNVVDQVDALTDLAYFVFGTAVEMDVDLERVFEIVHSANMKKLGPDGKPMRRPSDGKIIKPEGWVPPETRIAEYLSSVAKE